MRNVLLYGDHGARLILLASVPRIFLALTALMAVIATGWLASTRLFVSERAVADCPPGPAETGNSTDRGPYRTRLRVACLSRYGFGIQYWGQSYTPNQLATAPHGLLIIEAARASAQSSPDGRELWFSPGEVAQIRRDGRRPVLAYLNVALIETYRDYWLNAADRGEALSRLHAGDGADGARLAAYWTPEWREILAARVERILDHGFDGVMLDDVLKYHSWAVGEVKQRLTAEPPGMDAQGYARAMMTLVQELRMRADARRRGAVIVVNNGVFIGRDAGSDKGDDPGATFIAYRRAIDGILIESVMTPSPQDAALRVLDQDYGLFGMPVLDVEFLSSLPDLSPAEFASTVSVGADRFNFLPYLAADPRFNRLEKPLLPDRTAGRPARKSQN